MNKREWTWFAIRVIGFYLLIDAVRALPRVMSSAYSITHQFFLPGIADHGDLAHTVDTAQILRSTMGSLFVSSVSELIIYSVAGIYLLREGNFIFKLICPPDEP
jgi:hypothetical protein